MNLLQHVLPQFFLSRCFGIFLNCRARALKNWQIRRFCKVYGIDLSIAEHTRPECYPTFNAFFARRLKKTARPLAPKGLISPVDGTVMAMGKINHDQLIQAKGSLYSLQSLLNNHFVSDFIDGQFITFYLSPSDYHRVHMPLEGELKEMVYVPGRLFSVNPATTVKIPNIFARNERVIAYFSTAIGPVAVIFVGAMLVGSIQVAWENNPIRGRRVIHRHYQDHFFERGADIGHFAFGSTVIILLPKDRARFSVEQNQKILIGETFAE